MSSTIVVAAPADHELVRNVVGALSESGLDIYWERAEPDTPEWREAAARVLAARAVLFIWSSALRGEEAEPYADLARRALASGNAICVRLGTGTLPSGLEGCTTYDLRGWRARASSLFMLDLVAGVKAKAAGLDPPLPRAPRQLLLRRLAYGVPAAVAAVALILGLYRDMGLDRMASREEARDWAAIRPGSCADLRRFLELHSKGVHAGQAQALLQARTLQNGRRWSEAEHRFPIFVPVGMENGSEGLGAAQTLATRRAEAIAERNCRQIGAEARGQFKKVELRLGSYDCESFRSGVVCSLDGEAICRIVEPRETIVETCAAPR